MVRFAKKVCVDRWEALVQAPVRSTDQRLEQAASAVHALLTLPCRFAFSCVAIVTHKAVMERLQQYSMVNMARKFTVTECDLHLREPGRVLLPSRLTLSSGKSWSRRPSFIIASGAPPEDAVHVEVEPL